MEKCLVTQLKASVSNPDLPIFEVMQQFTLDAISASGNASMTDGQKWALNHFFYQIGAISNSGIYAKLSGLYLPLICGSNLNKALVDYKGENTASLSDKNVKFQSKGLIVNDSETATTANTMVQIASNHTNAGPSNVTVAIAMTEASVVPSDQAGMIMFGFRGQVSDTLATATLAYTSSAVRTSLFSKRMDYRSRVPVGCVVGTINGANTFAHFANDDGLFANNASSTSGSDPSSLKLAYLRWTNAFAPIGIYAYGQALSPTESEALCAAMQALVRAFAP